MPMFDGLNPIQTIMQAQEHLAALRQAFEDCESDYQWSSAYAITDFEAAPLNMSPEGAQDILNALADAHQLWMTAQGTPGFPAATLPYNFMASMRKIDGTR